MQIQTQSFAPQTYTRPATRPTVDQIQAEARESFSPSNGEQATPFYHPTRIAGRAIGGAITGAAAIALSGGGIMRTGLVAAGVGAAVYGIGGAIMGAIVGAASDSSPAAGAAIGFAGGAAFGGATGFVKGALIGAATGFIGTGPLAGAGAGAALGAIGL